MNNKCFRKDLWFRKGNRVISIGYYGTWDKPKFEMWTNGAKKGNPADVCFDWNFNFWRFHLGYTNFDYNRKIRERRERDAETD